MLLTVRISDGMLQLVMYSVWMNSETHALLTLIGDGIATAGLLQLVDYRPEYRHQWGWTTYYSQLRLDPVGRASAEEMLDALLSRSIATPARPLAHFFTGEGKRGDEPRAGEGADLAAFRQLILDKT
jgi:hypothetical protein